MVGGQEVKMSGIQTFTPTALEVTERAVAKVQSLKTEEDNDDLKLRVYVTGGGCSGFQYGFSFEDNAANNSFSRTLSPTRFWSL